VRVSAWRVSRKVRAIGRRRRFTCFTARLSAGLAVLLTFLTLVVVPQAPASPASSALHVSLGDPVSGIATLVPKTASKPKPPANEVLRAAQWPAESSATLPLAAAAGAGVHASAQLPSRVAGVPVWGQPVVDAKGAYAGPASLGVKVLGHAAAQAAGVTGVLLRVAPVGTGRGTVRLGVDYSSFAEAYGGDFAASLHLVSLPACALTTPQIATCRAQTPMASTNDLTARSLSAPLAVASAPVGSAAPEVVVAATSSSTGGDGGGAGGQYSATSLKPSGSWTAGGASGSFNYSYPITVPSAASPLVPSMSLSYDSGSVDGATASTQAQSSWVGDGWSTPESFVEQSFIPCTSSPEGTALQAATGNLCYNGSILTLSLDGVTSSLVCNAAETSCTPQSDNGETVQHVTSSNNGSGTHSADYWIITQRDGTQYEFGRNELPGWVSGDATTNSVNSVPVLSAHPPNGGTFTDPCYSSAGLSNSVCTMAYRWNLDYVKDLHGDAMAYYYKQDVNFYAQDLGGPNVSYVRDSHLDHIDYGFADGGAFGTVPDKVAFGTGDRCFSGTCDPLTAANTGSWPDVPQYLVCASVGTCANAGPSFFSTVRLTSITAEQWNGSAYNTVDSWALNESIPTTGTNNTSTLWLSAITHMGADTTAGGSAVTLPSVTFSPIMMSNRVNFSSGVGSGLGPLNRYRIVQITTETGSVITPSYELVDPCSATGVQSLTPSANTASCFPVFWTPTGYTAPFEDWFNKYVVQSVTQSDPTGGSPGLYTSYKYVGGAAWHYDDNELVQSKYRTYGQYRGYGDVQTFTGQTTDPSTETEAWFYRGMDGDWLSPTSTRSVTLTDSQGGKHADTNQLTGDTMESADYAYSGGPVDHSTITSYWVSPSTASRARAGLPTLTANAVGPVETWNRQALTDSGSVTWRHTATDTSYDANPASATFALPLFIYDQGDLALVGKAGSQETCQQITYAPANTSLNLVGLVAQNETDDKPCGGTGPGSSTAPAAGQNNALATPASLNRATDVVTATRTIYDDPADATTWPQPASISQSTPTVASPSIVQEATGYSGGAFVYGTKSTAVYDSYGRPTATYDALGKKTATTYQTTSYGTVTGTTTTNALNQAVAVTLDPERSLTLTSKDANNITTSVNYDGLGRTIAVWKHGRSPSTVPADTIYTYALSNSTASVVTTQTLNDESGYSASTELLDGLLRPRQTQTQAISSAAGRIITDTFYDSHGWVVRTNSNYYDPSSNPNNKLVTVPDNQVDRETLTSYDGLGRAVQVESKDNKSTPTVDNSTFTAYTGDKTITLPPTGGVASATVTDALGRTVELDQYTAAPSLATGTTGGFTTVGLTGGSSQATSYTFNAQGRAYQTVDPNGETWTTNYNYLGQVSTNTDPDSGTSGTTLYDAAGNKIQTTDSAGKTLSYTYDALGRQTAQYSAAVASQASSNQVSSSTYDNSNNVAGVTDAIGQLTTQTSYTSAGAFTAQQIAFNAFGESLGTTYMVPGTSALAGSYSYATTYKPVTGAPSLEVYPAAGALTQESVILGYSTFNGVDEPTTLSSASGSVQGVVYTPLGQVYQQNIGSNVKSLVTNTYDAHTGALTNSSLANTTLSSTPIDNTAYTYDPAGNPLSQTDTRNGSTNETQCFNYDALDRLTQAWTTASSAAASCATTPTSTNASTTVGDGITGSAYWTSWTFDALGQPRTQTQHSPTGGADTTTSYTYGGSAGSCASSSNGAHTLASTSTTGPSGTSTANYCSNSLGETTARPDQGGSGQQALTWNAQGSLSTVVGAAGTTGYIYDASGNVIERTDPGSTTLYLPNQQLALSTATKAVTATRYITLPGGGQVVVSGTNANYRYELSDQHGTAVVSVDSSIANPTWQQYTPYGAPRGAAPTAWNDPNGYLGKPQDATDALTIVGARQYDPALGRFLSLDPVLETGDPQQFNGYTYASDNPIAHSDPTGLYTVGMGCPDRQCQALSQAPSLTTPAPPHMGDGNRFHCPDGSCNPNYNLAPNLVHRPCGSPCAPHPHPWHANPTFGHDIPAQPCHGLGYMALDACIQASQAPDPISPVVTGIYNNSAKIDEGAAECIDVPVVGVGCAIATIVMAPVAIAHAISGDVGTSCSFTSGTPVLMADGSSKPIGAIKVGDKIENAVPGDPATGTHTVTALHVATDTDLVDLTINTPAGNKVVQTTGNHRFYDATTTTWTPAANLKAGDELDTPGEGRAEVLAIHRYTSARRMYNLTIDSIHTYYVEAGATPVLVHNDCGTIPARSVRFSQDSIRQTFQDGSSVMDLADSLANGAPVNFPPIKVFYDNQGVLRSLDNRRLFVGQYANVRVPYQWATPAQIARRNMTYVQNGDAIRVRGIGWFSFTGGK
jgi:RHS repeat-associated protein